MSNINELPWCKHGKTTLVYCADCEVDSLKNTLESQKEEIERLQKPALSLAYRVLKQKYEQDAESYIEHIFKIESEIESLKAITELAVTCLQRIDSIRETFPASFRPHNVEAAFIKAERLTTEALEQIERLQNE